MQSAKKQNPKIDDRNDDTLRGPRPRFESGTELTAHRSADAHSIEDFVDPFVDPITENALDPFDRALIDTFAFDDDDAIAIDDADFVDEEPDDTVRMERPTFALSKK